MNVESAIALGIALVTQANFVLGMKWFRHSKHKTPAKTLLTVTAGIVMAVQLLLIAFTPSAGPLLIAVGAGLNLLALIVYWWARLSHGKDRPAFACVPTTPQHLTQSGPYRLIRHPIYTAYLLSWVAGVFLCAQPWLLLTVLVMGIQYYLTANQEEQWFSQSELAGDYKQYQGRTGMFLPSVQGMLRRSA